MATLARLVNRSLSLVGLRLQRVAAEAGSKSGSAKPFYAPHETCQIPELASLYRLFLGERRNGFFVEVGAYDGISFSNTSCLADVGWSGLLIEPIPAYAEACRVRYHGNGRLRVVETAVGASRSSIEISVAGSLTTTNRGLLDAYRNISWARHAVKQTTTLTVDLRTLDEILETEGVSAPIDVLSVDVEGGEAGVFAGLTLPRWRPRLVVAELVHTHPDLFRISAGDAQLQRSIEREGYSVVYKDSINTVFAADA